MPPQRIQDPWQAAVTVLCRHRLFNLRQQGSITQMQMDHFLSSIFLWQFSGQLIYNKA